MIHRGVPLLPFAILALAASLSTYAQSVVSTHSGVVYFFEGSVFIEDQPLEQKFGTFPDIGDGHELRTEHGRAEVLLTPGVFLRLNENSAIRMLSIKLSDTRVELLDGSAILEANEASPGASVTVIHKNWQVKIPQTGVYRIDSQPAQLRVYKGEAEISTEGQREGVAVREGEKLPLAPVLVPEPSTIAAGSDSFKNWTMGRSQMISSDNATAAGIVDDPSLIDNPDTALAGLSYFPMTGIPSLGMTNPYGVSFWSPFQSRLSSMYYPTSLWIPLSRMAERSSLPPVSAKQDHPPTAPGWRNASGHPADQNPLPFAVVAANLATHLRATLRSARGWPPLKQ